MMSRLYLIHFAQVHQEFRLPELSSVAEMYGIRYTLDPKPDPSRPFMLIQLDQEDHVRLLARRCILIKAVYEYYAQGSSYYTLHEENMQSKPLWEKYAENTSFRFLVTAYQHKIPLARQTEVIESFAYMSFVGKIDMKNPEITLVCFEEYESDHTADTNFRQVFFGRLLEEGSARPLIRHFDVKKRVYYGNTSMDAEISLLMANQTLASPGKLIYDPFIGTGSMAYPTAHFGALIFGSDIDGRQMRGKERIPGVLRAAAQYGMRSRIIDLATFDITQNPWRCGQLFDAIVTDPPYGVRAGAKRLGRKKSNSKKPRQNDDALPLNRPFIPSTKPYELSHLICDLILFSRYMLKPGGRLVFFLPTVSDEYDELDIDTSLCEGMEVIANSLQDFGSWGRRLVTIKKTSHEGNPPPTFEVAIDKEAEHVPAHKYFRVKYFEGFKKTSVKDAQ